MVLKTARLTAEDEGVSTALRETLKLLLTQSISPILIWKPAEVGGRTCIPEQISMVGNGIRE